MSKREDFNGDGAVDESDIALFITSFGEKSSEDTNQADLDNDGLDIYEMMKALNK